ncbi:MAG: hypothetical protein Q4P15_05550, partial [Propionibacteriaceae bacterium]|nr:hypothetical protein [Propionibacteriaceae bacterium]
MSSAPAAVACRAGVVISTMLVCALSALLAGCTPDDNDVIVGAVDTIYEQAEGVSPAQRETRKAHDVAVLQWAAELDLVEARTAKQLRGEHEATQGGNAANQSDDKPFGVTG